jgi:predicted dinucleotide-binding enzyme
MKSRSPLGVSAGSKNRRALVIAGDDAAAKAAVTKLLDDFGFDTWMPGPCEKDGAFNAIRRASVHVGRQRNLRKDLAAAKRYADQ